MDCIDIENFSKRAAVRVTRSFLDMLKERARKQFGSLAKLSKLMNSSELAEATLYSMLKNNRQRQLFPLSVLLHCCHACGINANELQQSITEYGLRKGSCRVRRPILPVHVTPIFDMIYAHNIGDGFVVNPQRNRHPYFGYRQFDPLYRLLYWEKLQWVFGDINLPYERALKTTEIYCAPTISQFFFKAYNCGVRDFISETALLPQEILAKSKDHLLAVLIAFLIDEGHVDGSCLEIRLKNRALIRQLHFICHKLKYPATVSEEPNDYAVLYILSRGIRVFWSDFIQFLERYPVADMGWKGKAIARYIKSSQCPVKYKPGNKEHILKLLKSERLTVNEIAERTQMTRQGARYFIHLLIHEKKIRKSDIAKYGANIYATIT